MGANTIPAPPVKKGGRKNNGATKKTDSGPQKRDKEIVTSPVAKPGKKTQQKPK